MRIQGSCPVQEQLVHVWLGRLFFFFSEFPEKSNKRKAVSTRRVLSKILLQSPKEYKDLQIVFSTSIIQEIGFEPERDAFLYNAFINTWLLVHDNTTSTLCQQQELEFFWSATRSERCNVIKYFAWENWRSSTPGGKNSVFKHKSLFQGNLFQISILVLFCKRPQLKEIAIFFLFEKNPKPHPSNFILLMLFTCSEFLIYANMMKRSQKETECAPPNEFHNTVFFSCNWMSEVRYTEGPGAAEVLKFLRRVDFPWHFFPFVLWLPKKVQRAEL